MQLADLVQRDSWQRACAAIAFIRANGQHAFRHSILPLLPAIRALATVELLPLPMRRRTAFDLRASAVQAAIKASSFSVDRFLDSRYVRAVLSE